MMFHEICVLGKGSRGFFLFCFQVTLPLKFAAVISSRSSFFVFLFYISRCYWDLVLRVDGRRLCLD